MKTDNEANFRKLWRELAKANYRSIFMGLSSIVDYKIDWAEKIGVYNHNILISSMAACPACYEAFKRAKVGMRKVYWCDKCRFPCSKCPLDWGDADCERYGTLYDRWNNAKTVKTVRKYADLISRMEWR